MLGWHTTRRAWLVTPSKQLAGWALDDINTRHYLYENGPYTIATAAVSPVTPGVIGPIQLPDDIITVMSQTGIMGVQRAISTARGSVSALVRTAAMAPDATIALCRKSTQPLEELIPTVQSALSHLFTNPTELVHLVTSLDTPLDWIILGYVVNVCIHHWGGGTNKILIGKTVALWAQAGYWQVADVLATTIQNKLPMNFSQMGHNVQWRHYDPEYYQRIQRYFRVNPKGYDILSYFQNPAPRYFNSLVSFKTIAQAAIQGVDARIEIWNVTSMDLVDEMTKLTHDEYRALWHSKMLGGWLIATYHETLEMWLDGHMADYDSDSETFKHIPVCPDGSVAVALQDGVIDHVAINTKYGYRMARTPIDFNRFWACDLSEIIKPKDDAKPLPRLLRTFTQADSTLALGTPQQAVTKCVTYMRLIATYQ